MQGLFKAVMIGAPVAALMIVLTLYLMGEHTAEVQVEDASFDRDFAHVMGTVEKKKGEKKYWEQQEAAAQQRYSSSREELKVKKAKVEKADESLTRELEKADPELSKALEKR